MALDQRLLTTVVALKARGNYSHIAERLQLVYTLLCIKHDCANCMRLIPETSVTAHA